MKTIQVETTTINVRIPTPLYDKAKAKSNQTGIPLDIAIYHALDTWVAPKIVYPNEHETTLNLRRMLPAKKNPHDLARQALDQGWMKFVDFDCEPPVLILAVGVPGMTKANIKTTFVDVAAGIDRP